MRRFIANIRMARCPRADETAKVNAGKLCDRYVIGDVLKSGSHITRFTGWHWFKTVILMQFFSTSGSPDLRYGTGVTIDVLLAVNTVAKNIHRFSLVTPPSVANSWFVKLGNSDERQR